MDKDTVEFFLAMQKLTGGAEPGMLNWYLDLNKKLRLDKDQDKARALAEKQQEIADEQRELEKLPGYGVF